MMRSGFSDGRASCHGLDAGEMRAIGAGAGDQFDMAVEQ